MKHLIARRPALAVLAIGAFALLSSAFAAAAAAQTTSFQASVTAKGARGAGTGQGTKPSTGCANGAYTCGTANIAGHGAASWNLYITSNTNVETSCGSTYTAITYFTLASDPSSTLVIDESGNLCGPGLNANGYFKEDPNASGHPFTALGTWTIDTTDSTGQFAGLLGGPDTGGTDTLQFDGAHIAGSYSGTLG